MSRPDGLTDIAIDTPPSSGGLLYKIEEVNMNPTGCVPIYTVSNVANPNITFEDVKPTDRPVGNMCYEPLSEGDLVLFAFVPREGEEDDEPLCNEDGCNYLFIAGEEIKTIECQ